MWPISKGMDEDEMKCQQDKEPNSTQCNLYEQLESSVECNEFNGNKTRSLSTENVYKSQEENRVNTHKSNDNRNNINKSYGDSRVNPCRSDGNKNMNTCYDESRSNTKRFCEDSRSNVKKFTFEGDQPSVKILSKLKRLYVDPGEREPEEFPQRSHRPRRAEYNTGERQQNRRRQSSVPKSNISDDYEQVYYNGLVDMCNCQPNRNSQKQQQQNCYQNQEATPRRQSYLDRVPSADECRMKRSCIESSADVGQVKECSLTNRKQGRRQQLEEQWQQPNEEQVNELQTDNIMARVEMQRLYSLQCIERHQQALVLEIQQLLKNEQEQFQLRMTSGEQKFARLRRQTDSRCSQEQERKLQLPVLEQYKPTPFVRQQYKPAQQINFRNIPVQKQSLSTPRQPVASKQVRRYGTQYRGQTLTANHSRDTEDSRKEQQRQSMMCPSCSVLNRPQPAAKPKQTAKCVLESTLQADSCSSFEFDEIQMPVGSAFPDQANCRTDPNEFITSLPPSRSKFQYNCAPDMITCNDKKKKSANNDDQCRRRNNTAPNESQRAYVSPQDTISEYYLSTRKNTSSSSSAPCLQTQMSNCSDSDAYPKQN